MALNKGYKTKHQSGIVHADEVKAVGDPPKPPAGVRGHGETPEHNAKSKHTTRKFKSHKPE